MNKIPHLFSPNEQHLPGKLEASEDIISGKVLRAEEEIRGLEMLRSETFSMF